MGPYIDTLWLWSKSWTRLNCCGFMSLFRDFSMEFSIWREFMGIASLSKDRVKSFQIKWKIWRINTVNYDFMKINKPNRRKEQNEEKNIIQSLDREYYYKLKFDSYFVCEKYMTFRCEYRWFQWQESIDIVNLRSIEIRLCGTLGETTDNINLTYQESNNDFFLSTQLIQLPESRQRSFLLEQTQIET